MAEKFDKLVKIGEEVCKKEFAEYENKYREFVTSYTKAIALTATYSAFHSGKSWPKEFFKDSPNPTTFGDLFKWMFDKDYGSRYYDQKDVVDEGDSVYLDSITGKEYKTRIEAAGRVPLAPGDSEDKGLPDDIIEAAIAGNDEIAQIYKSLRRNYRDTQNYLTYKKILQEITISVYSEKVVKQYLEKVTSEGIRTWTVEKFLEIWRDGLQGKSSLQTDVGIADFVAREYPLYQEVYGGNFWTVIDNPWSKRNNPEGPQVLVDAIREKSPDPDAAKGTTASGTTASGTSASDASAATGPSASTPLKYTPFVEGLVDGYQISAKTDLPDFMIYVSDPKTWKELNAVEEGEEAMDGEEDEYSEVPFVGEGENLELFETKETLVIEKETAANTDYSKAAIESNSSIGGSADAVSNSDGTVSALLASSPVTTESEAGKYKDSMVPPSFNSTPIYSQGGDPRWNKKSYDLNGKCGDNSTVGSSGCGPTSMSMLVNHWAIKGKSKFTSPHDMAKLFERTGCRVCGAGSGISTEKIKKAFKEIFGLVLETGVGVAKVEKYVKAGYPSVISGKKYNGYNILGNATDAHYNGGHFVCLTGVDSQGRIRVNDPGRNANAATARNPGKGAITHFPAGKGLSSCVTVNQTIVVYPVDDSTGANIA